MYLVELEAGREQLYQSVDALASAIRRGEIGPRSRIFHRTSSSWVSITVHPEYRKAAATLASEPLPPLSRNQWTFFGVEPWSREISEPPQAGTAGDAPVTETSEHRQGLMQRVRRTLRGLAFSPKTSGTPAD
ncbi:MAG: hypothetical protein ACREM9_04440 [Gemmatimonadales bacterium]